MSEITISAVVRLKNDRDPEIVDNSIQVININKIQNANISIEINKTNYKFIYSSILNGYVCDKCMILYIQTKWVFVFSCITSGKQSDIYYCYNNNGSNDKVDIVDIQSLFRSPKITFYNNNLLIDDKNVKFTDICTFFDIKSCSFSNLRKILETAKIRIIS